MSFKLKQKFVSFLVEKKDNPQLFIWTFLTQVFIQSLCFFHPHPFIICLNPKSKLFTYFLFLISPRSFIFLAADGWARAAEKLDTDSLYKSGVKSSDWIGIPVTWMMLLTILLQ